MPAYNLALYAKWTPKQHTVNFFTTYDEMVAYETGASSEYLYQYDNVLHGTIIAQEIMPLKKLSKNIKPKPTENINGF